MRLAVFLSPPERKTLREGVRVFKERICGNCGGGEKRGRGGRNGGDVARIFKGKHVKNRALRIRTKDGKV